MSQYETIIGLEVHVELKTKTKIFCSSSTEFGGDPNTHVCPVCLGLPGSLPVVNREVLNSAIMVGVALNCNISAYSKFDRKNYYYPDLPKNYQISQYDLPLAFSGYLEFDIDGQSKRVGITRVHMEEDAGKLVHQGSIATTPYSFVDYNRTGVPLVEIVSEPDIRSSEEAGAYLEKLKAIIQYTGVSDCKMEEGSLRCDANISVRPWDSNTFGVKTEIKNMNSFKSLQRAIVYEVERQIEVLGDGGRIVQETRTWDEARGVTLSMRSKEQAHDYRYFPDPDLVPIVIDRDWVERVRSLLPELPDQRKVRYVKEYGIPAYDASVITATKELADYFEECLVWYPNAKAVSNWVMGDLSRLLKANGMEIMQCRISPVQLAAMLELIDEGTISGKIAKTVFEVMFDTGKEPAQIVKEKGLIQITDEGAIAVVVQQVLDANPKVVDDFRDGKERALGFLVGQVMKLTRGKASPEMVNNILKERIK